MAALITVGVDMSSAFVITNIPSSLTITESRVVAYGPNSAYRIEEGISGGNIYINAITPGETVELFGSSSSRNTDIKKQLQSDFGIITSVDESAKSYPYISRIVDKRIYGITDDKNLRLLNTPGAGSHNAIYRGKNLGSAVTAEQYAAIKDGSFDDLYIGDYWLIDDIHYRIAAFDYYMGLEYFGTGSYDNTVVDHHVVIVPDELLSMAQMNTSRTIAGGYTYANIRMDTVNGLRYVQTILISNFTSDHLLYVPQLYVASLSETNRPANTFSVANETLWLMTEENVYGTKFFSCKYDPAQDASFYGYRTYDLDQYPLFALRRDLIPSSHGYWLRDTGMAGTFCGVHAYNYPSMFYADNEAGVRPAFCLKG